MPLHHASSVSVSTCIELTADGDVSYELDIDNEQVNFTFGYHRDYQLELSARDLRRMIELGTRALADMASELAEDRENATCAVS